MPSLSAKNDHSPVCYAYDYTEGAWVGIDGESQPLLNRGFLYGDGFFDTLAVYQGSIQIFDQHRIKSGAAAAALSFPFPSPAFEALAEVVGGEGVLRFYAYAPGGVGGSASVERVELRAVFTPQALETSLATHAVALAAEPVFSQGLVYRHKTLSRLPYVQALRQLSGSQATDALLCNEHHRLASLTSSCITYGLAGRCYVIPTAEGCMAGAARAAFLSLTNAPERMLPLSELPAVDWILGLNSLGPRHIIRFRDLRFGNPYPEILAALHRLYPFLKR